MGSHTPDVVEFVRTVNAAGGAYHRIDFGDGLVLEGEHDMLLSARNFFSLSRSGLLFTKVAAEAFDSRSDTPNGALGQTRFCTFGT